MRFVLKSVVAEAECEGTWANSQEEPKLDTLTLKPDMRPLGVCADRAGWWLMFPGALLSKGNCFISHKSLYFVWYFP